MTEAESLQRMNDWVAVRIMGWEVLEVGCFYNASDSPRQWTLTEWMREVGIEQMGRYYIDVEHDFWVDSREWLPGARMASEGEVLEYMRVHGSEVSLTWDTRRGVWRCAWRYEGKLLNGEAEESKFAVYQAVLQQAEMEARIAA